MIKSKVMNNAVWLIMGKVVQSLIALVVSMLTARYLGPSNYGIISYAASLVAFAVPVMTLGLSNILVQEVTNYPEEEGEIFGTSILMSLISALACIIGIAAYTMVVDAGEPTTNIVVILYSILLIFQAMELMQYWFQAKLLSKYMAIGSSIACVIVAAYKVILLANQASVEFFAISNSLEYLLIFVFLLCMYKKLGGAKLRISKNIAKRMFNSSKHYIVSSLMVTIFAQTDKIMIKLMIGESEVGYYSAAVTCAGLTSFVFSAVIDSMRPSIFVNKKIGNESAYETGIARTYCVVIYFAAIQSVFMAVFSEFIINFLYGADYTPAIAALRIVVWYTTFSYIGGVRNIWILGENKQKYLWILNLGGAVANVLLNYILIPIMGINGAAIASLFTQIFTNIFMNMLVRPLKYNNVLMVKGLNPKLILDYFKSRR